MQNEKPKVLKGTTDECAVFINTDKYVKWVKEAKKVKEKLQRIKKLGGK